MRRTGKSHFGKNHIPWTARLADLVANNTSVPAVRLSGPFGCTDFSEYENLVLFAGGIGITPMIAIFNDLLRKAREGTAPPTVRFVNLVWMARKISDFRLFEEFLQLAMEAEKQGGDQLSAKAKHSRAISSNSGHSGESSTDPEPTDFFKPPPLHSKMSVAQQLGIGLDQVTGASIGNIRFRLQLFCTSRESLSGTSTGSILEFINLLITQGRCDIPAQLKQAGHGPQTIAATCGPMTLSLAVSEAAWKAGCDFHAEQFSF